MVLVDDHKAIINQHHLLLSGWAIASPNLTIN